LLGHWKLSRDTSNISADDIRLLATGEVVFLVLREKNSEADVDS